MSLISLNTASLYNLRGNKVKKNLKELLGIDTEQVIVFAAFVNSITPDKIADLVFYGIVDARDSAECIKQKLVRCIQEIQSEKAGDCNEKHVYLYNLVFEKSIAPILFEKDRIATCNPSFEIPHTFGDSEMCVGGDEMYWFFLTRRSPQVEHKLQNIIPLQTVKVQEPIPYQKSCEKSPLINKKGFCIRSTYCFMVMMGRDDALQFLEWCNEKGWIKDFKEMKIAHMRMVKNVLANFCLKVTRKLMQVTKDTYDFSFSEVECKKIVLSILNKVELSDEAFAIVSEWVNEMTRNVLQVMKQDFLKFLQLDIPITIEKVRSIILVHHHSGKNRSIHTKVFTFYNKECMRTYQEMLQKLRQYRFCALSCDKKMMIEYEAEYKT